MLEKIESNLASAVSHPKLLILDMSAVPSIDIGGSTMLSQLCKKMKDTGTELRIVGALSNVRDLLRKVGIEDYSGQISRATSIYQTVEEFNSTMKTSTDV